MHTHDLSAWTHDQVFAEGSHAAGRGTRINDCAASRSARTVPIEGE